MILLYSLTLNSLCKIKIFSSNHQNDELALTEIKFDSDVHISVLLALIEFIYTGNLKNTNAITAEIALDLIALVIQIRFALIFSLLVSKWELKPSVLMLKIFLILLVNISNKIILTLNQDLKLQSGS